MAIQEDEVAGEDNQPFALVAVECLEAVIQQLCQFTRISDEAKESYAIGATYGASLSITALSLNPTLWQSLRVTTEEL